MHQPPDFLMIHPDPGMEEPHVDTHDSFGITPEVVGIPDQSEAKFILGIFVAVYRGIWGLQPVVVAGPGYTGQGTQGLYGKLVYILF